MTADTRRAADLLGAVRDRAEPKPMVVAPPVEEPLDLRAADLLDRAADRIEDPENWTTGRLVTWAYGTTCAVGAIAVEAGGSVYDISGQGTERYPYLLKDPVYRRAYAEANEESLRRYNGKLYNVNDSSRRRFVWTGFLRGRYVTGREAAIKAMRDAAKRLREGVQRA